MPTVRPRYQVTETADVATALDRAQRHWPNLSRSQSLVRLLQVGADTLLVENAHRRERIALLTSTFETKYAEVYPDGYLSDLREDWPT